MCHFVIHATVTVILAIALVGCGNSQHAGKPLTPGLHGAGAETTFLFSPYKYTGALQDAPNNTIRTRVTGASMSLVDSLPEGLNALTLAFATGTCVDEQWDGFTSTRKAVATIRELDKAGVYYVISTGGGGNKIFTCNDPADFLAFIKRYHTPHMLGVDFDVELSQDQAMVDNLVKDTKVAAKHYPDMRFSFTVATFGSTSRATPNLGNLGARILKSIRAHDLDHYLINLMVMEYDQTLPIRCVIGSNGRCDMGASAIAAAKNMHALFGVPYNKMELTPMIGRNHAQGTPEIFTLEDAREVAAFVKEKGIAGVHFWSYDRDRDCTTARQHPRSTCNSYGKAGTFGYTRAFLKAFGGTAYAP